MEKKIISIEEIYKKSNVSSSYMYAVILLLILLFGMSYYYQI